jgi:hypothetical protein
MSFVKFVPLIFLLLLAGSFPAAAQLSPWDFGGYAKDLITYTDGTIGGLPIAYGEWQNSAQLRLNLSWYPAMNYTATVQGRSVITYQKNIKSLNRLLGFFETDTYYFDFKYEYDNAEDWYAFSEIDRLHFMYTWQDLNIITGRQRIAWGTCLVWNPTDLFNPFNILDFDYEERPGTDALQVQYYTGPLSQFNVAITPGRTRDQVIYAGRYVTNWRSYDFSLIAGWQKNSLRLAGSWAGQLYDGGFRGEVLFTDPDMHYRIFSFEDFGFISRSVTDPFWTIAVSYDYTFKNSFYIHSEYLYNGLGTTDNAGARRYEIIYTGELTPARHSVFQEFAYQITPLLRGNIFVILNPTDHSWIAAPSLQYSLGNNWELYLLAFPSGGAQNTEYGGYPDQYFGRLKVAF